MSSRTRRLLNKTSQAKINIDLRQRACRVLAEMANAGEIPENIRISRACYLSKKKSTAAVLDDLRLIEISSHLIKVLEHMILAKLKQLNSAIIQSGDYQRVLQNSKERIS